MTNDNFYFFSVNDFKQNFKTWLEEYFTEHPIVITENDKQDFLTISEIAEYLKVSKLTIYNWTKQGKLQAKIIGRRKLYNKAEVRSALLKFDHLKYKR